RIRNAWKARCASHANASGWQKSVSSLARVGQRRSISTGSGCSSRTVTATPDRHRTMSGRVNLMAALSAVSGPGCRLWNRLAGYARSRTFNEGRVVGRHGEVMRAAGQLTELVAG